jgi:hypothetical protein
MAGFIESIYNFENLKTGCSLKKVSEASASVNIRPSCFAGERKSQRQKEP